MAIFEVRVTRTVEEQYLDLCVRAKSAKAARIKAVRLAKASMTAWADSSDAAYEASGADKLDFIPDCEVL